MLRLLRPLAAAIVSLALGTAPSLAASPDPSPHSHGSGSPNLSSPAAELRVALDRLLAEHAFLTIEQMRSGLIDAPDFEAAAAAVEGNSTEVAAAIGSIYGEAAVDPFGEIWRSHIGYLVDYARALGDSDTAAQAAALSGLATYRVTLREFLANANPGVSLGGITDALDMHTAQLVEFIAAEHRGDHAAAYAIERQAYPHMFELGDALAKVIANKFPERYTGLDIAYSAAGSLRVTLDRILGEHAFLAAEAMRSGVVGADDFESGKAAIAGNSADLQAVVEAAYGPDAAASFRSLWDGHVAGYVAYIDASRANDSAARDTATAQVTLYANQLASFLAAANPELDAGTLSTLFEEHAGHLIGQVEAFAASDYDRTYELVRTGYGHMFTAGEALSVGIAAQMPDKFPSDAPAPATDAETHAGHGRSGVFGLVLMGGVLLVGIALFAVRRRSLWSRPRER